MKELILLTKGKEIHLMIKKLLLMFFLIVPFCGKGQDTILIDNEIYRLTTFYSSIDSSAFVRQYWFKQDGYRLNVILYTRNEQVKKIFIKKGDLRMGFNFDLGPNGNLKWFKTINLNVESGPIIDFYIDGKIKRYYNYGFEMSDLLLPEKELEVEEDLGFIIETSYYIYYKEKKGNEYYFSENGDLTDVIEYNGISR